MERKIEANKSSRKWNKSVFGQMATARMFVSMAWFIQMSLLISHGFGVGSSWNGENVFVKRWS